MKLTVTYDIHAIESSLSLRQVRLLMRETLTRRSLEEDSPPQRFAFGESNARLGLMAGAYDGYAGVKVVALGNRQGHSGVYLLFKDAELIAQFDGGTLTSLRTAAVSAAVAEKLAPSVKKIALLGTGRQAEAHAQALRDLYPDAEFVVWGRSKESLERFNTSLVDLVTQSLEAAVKNTDLICTLTAAKEPFLNNEYLNPEVLICAVGSCLPTHRELTSNLIQQSIRYVDSLPSARREAGDLLLALEGGKMVGNDLAHEIGQVFRRELPVPSGIRVFKSLGLPIEDLNLAKAIYQRLQ